MSCCGGSSFAGYAATSAYNAAAASGIYGAPAVSATPGYGVTLVDRGSIQGVRGASSGCVGVCAPDATAGSAASLPGVIIVPDPTTGALRIVATQACKSALSDNTTTLISASGQPVNTITPFGIDAQLLAARGNSCCQIRRQI